MLVEFKFESQNGKTYLVEVDSCIVWIKTHIVMPIQAYPLGIVGWRAFTIQSPMNWRGDVDNLPDDLKRYVEKYTRNMAFL
jgi:hypothetical protein